VSDYLVNLGTNRAAKSLLGSLGIPVPQKLRRAQGPFTAKPLVSLTAWSGGTGSDLDLQDLLHDLGADRGDQESDVLLFDACGLTGAEGLKELYRAFHPRIRGLRPSGRIIVLGRPELCTESTEHAVAQAALDGFVRSMAKEIGRKGATANLLQVEPGAESHVRGALRFLLSDHAAYISGQPLAIRDRGEAPAFSPRSLQGRVALVTGAARGIGAETARRLAEEGATVVLLDREETVGVLEAAAVTLKGHSLTCDVLAPDAPQRITDTLTALGGVDIVVHNAGVTRDRTLGRMPEPDWDLVMGVNLAAILKIHDALARGPLADGARIVLLSSTVGLAGNVGQTNYAATKAAMAGLSRRLGRDLAGRGIGVFAVAPGFIETRMTETIPFATREGARRLNNLSQGGLPEDVAEAITFLCTDGASGLSGGVLRVCGGSLIGA
jgi:3-oxoacyl-[acyl-carrier protein] reductase